MLLIFGWPECSCSNASQVTPVFCSAHSMALTSLIIQAGVFTIYPPKTHLLPSTPTLIHPHWLPYSSSSTSQTFQPQGLCTHCSIHHEHSSSLRRNGIGTILPVLQMTKLRSIIFWRTQNWQDVRVSITPVCLASALITLLCSLSVLVFCSLILVVKKSHKTWILLLDNQQLFTHGQAT